MKPLIIVESPAKARALRRIVGQTASVVATAGHVRELPRRPSDVPERYRDQAWARLGLDPDNDFRALHVPTSQGVKALATLRELTPSHHPVILATDDDREGAAIARSLVEELQLDEREVVRAPLRELTRQGWDDALAHARPLSSDRGLTEAQEARRAADRLIGYTFSPVAWKRVGPGTAVGRVQTAAAGLVNERELRRLAFTPLPITDLTVEATLAGRPMTLQAVAMDGQRLATDRDHDPETGAHLEGLRLPPEAVQALQAQLASGPTQLSGATQRTHTEVIAAPEAFNTATALMAICQATGQPPRLVAQILQRLYERGLITYPRTDSTALSASGAGRLRESASAAWGEHLSGAPDTREPGVHEAIRPAGQMLTPQEVAGLSADEQTAYAMIYDRAVASQMEPAQVSVTVTTAQLRLGNHTFDLEARDTRLTHPGHLALTELS